MSREGQSSVRVFLQIDRLRWPTDLFCDVAGSQSLRSTECFQTCSALRFLTPCHELRASFGSCSHGTITLRAPTLRLVSSVRSTNLPLLDTVLSALPDGPMYMGAIYRWNYDLSHEILTRWGGGACDTCIGPFQFATGTLMVLDRTLCAEFIQKRMGERYLAPLDAWSSNHRTLYEDAWLGMILTLNQVNLTYYNTRLMHNDRDGFWVPTTLLQFHNRHKIGCRNRQLHAYYKVRNNCRPRVNWQVARSFRGLRTLTAHPKPGAGCAGEVDLRNATVRASYGVSDCPPPPNCKKCNVKKRTND